MQVVAEKVRELEGWVVELVPSSQWDAFCCPMGGDEDLGASLLWWCCFLLCLALHPTCDLFLVTPAIKELNF